MIANGANATCTINNNDQAAHLTLVKTVTNDNGGTALPTAWTLAAAGPTPITGTTGSASVTNAAVNAGTYTLSESGGPANYTPGAWTCTAGTLTGASLVLPLNTSATCTINNNDQAAHLTLVKTVTNDNGGTAVGHRLDPGRRGTDADHGHHRLGGGHECAGERRYLHAVRSRRTDRLRGGSLDLHRRHSHRSQPGAADRRQCHLHASTTTTSRRHSPWSRR